MTFKEGKFGAKLIVLFLVLGNVLATVLPATVLAKTPAKPIESQMTLLLLYENNCQLCDLIDGYETAIISGLQSALSKDKLTNKVEAYSLYRNKTTNEAFASPLLVVGDVKTDSFDGLDNFLKISNQASEIYKTSSSSKQTMLYPAWVYYPTGKSITVADGALVASGITKNADGSANISATTSKVITLINSALDKNPPSLNIEPGQTGEKLKQSPNVFNIDPSAEGAVNTKPANGTDLDSANGKTNSGIFISITVPGGELKIGNPNPIEIKYTIKSKNENKKFERMDLFISDSIEQGNPKWHMKCSTASSDNLCNFKGTNLGGTGNFQWDSVKSESKPGAHKIRIVLWDSTELPKIQTGDNAGLAQIAQTKALAYYDYPIMLSGKQVLTDVKATKNEDGTVTVDAKADNTVDSVEVTIDDNKNGRRDKTQAKPDSDGIIQATLGDTQKPTSDGGKTDTGGILTEPESKTKTPPILTPDKSRTNPTQSTPKTTPVKKETNTLKKLWDKLFGVLSPLAIAQEDDKKADDDTATLAAKGKDGKIAGTEVVKAFAVKPPTDTGGSSTIEDPIDFATLLTGIKSFVKTDTDNPDLVFQSRTIGLINFMFAIGSAIMMLVTIWSGILYIFSMGNEEQATKAKKNFINIIIGLVLMLGSFTIVRIISRVLGSGLIS